MNATRTAVSAVALAFSLTVPPLAPADVVTLTPSKDTTLYQPAFTEENGNGAGPALFVGNTGGFSARRALLSFDVAAAVPAGATITSVSLTLNVNKSGGTSESIELHRLAADWGQGASNAGETHDGAGTAAAANDATWLHRFFPGTAWSTPGGDFSPTSSSSAVVPSFGPFTIPSTLQLVADVQSFLNTPSSNFGWILLGDETVYSSATRIDSRESTTPNFRPALAITYSVPEPASLSLLAITAIPLIRPRRRAR